MSKVVKSLLVSILISLSFGGLIGCAGSQANESIAKGKNLINNKSYCKALISFEMALDEDPKNEEAKSLKSMIENYFAAERALKEGEIEKAEIKLDAIGEKDKNFKAFHESVITLKDSIEKKAQYNKDLNSDIEKLSKLIDNKSYTEASMLCKSISGRELTENQKEKLEHLRVKLAMGIETISDNKDKNENKNANAGLAVKAIR